MKELIGFAAVALAFVAYAPYFRDILRHKIQPHPFSWFIWGFAASLILYYRFYMAVVREPILP
jgi:hypothetical protein